MLVGIRGGPAVGREAARRAHQPVDDFPARDRATSHCDFGPRDIALDAAADGHLTPRRGPCINERAAIGNRARAEAGISIHADGGPTSGHGFHVNVPADIPGYTDDIYVASHTLGAALRDTYASETGISPSTYIGSGGLVERRDFGGLNLSDVPKVLFETANMQNAGDAALLENPTVRQRIASALANGLARYFAARG